jgi:uncharacterized repeat protein (TIGR01451 family)
MSSCWSAVVLTLLAVPAVAQTYEISWWTVDAGGAMGNAGGTFVVDSTAGQADAGGPFAASPYVLHSGFWAIAAGAAGGPQADLSAAKTDGQTTAIPGQLVTYTLTVANAGPADVSGATVSDVVPAALVGAAWTCAASPGSSCTASGSGSIDDTANILAGGMLTYTLTATVDPAATGTLDNTALVTAPGGVLDTDPANNSATDSDTLTPQADLSITKTDSPDPVSAEGTLTYTLTLTNLGPSASSGMTVTDALPAEVTFVSSTPGTPVCAESAGTLTCTLGGMLPAASQTVTIQTLVVASAVGSISNTATVSGNETDPVSANDSASEPTQVLIRAEGELIHGTSLWADLASVGGVPDQDLFRIHQAAHASYEVVVDSTSGDLGTGQGPALDRLASDAVTVVQSSLPAGVGHSRSLRWANAAGSPVNDEYVRVRSQGCSSSCDAQDAYRIRSYETTYAISRFNNSATQVTVLVIQNVSSATVSGEAAFRAAGSGALLHVQPFSVAGHGVFVLATAGVPALQGQSGSVTVDHDGPYGSLAGKAVAVEPATGFTFDTEMIPRRVR